MKLFKTLLCASMLLSCQAVFGSLGQCCGCLLGTGVVSVASLVGYVKYQQVCESYEYAYMTAVCAQMQKKLDGRAKSSDVRKRKSVPSTSYVSVPGSSTIPELDNLASSHKKTQEKKDN